MKNFNIFLIVFFMPFILFNCSKSTDNEYTPVKKLNLDSLTLESSLKGWELYSWQNGNEYNYSLLIGTNRLKTYEEVISNEITVFGIDSLKLLLAKLPEGEYIFWVGKSWLSSIWKENYKNLGLPDEKTVNEIKSYCIQKKLQLVISQ
ncbi:MAG: hypothetical protein IPH57_16995 [Saprospiraceae bacterium]|nr:hypothetical protein [Saprospiraceae bacterium]